MGTRGPRAKKLAPAEATKKYPSPPAHMTDRAKQLWCDIVSDFPQDHFQPKHFALLEVYVESAARHEQATAQLTEEGLTIKNERTGVVKKNPLLNIIADEAQKMTSLCTKLSLNISPQGSANAITPAYKRRPAGLLFGGSEKTESKVGQRQN